MMTYRTPAQIEHDLNLIIFGDDYYEKLNRAAREQKAIDDAEHDPDDARWSDMTREVLAEARARRNVGEAEREADRAIDIIGESVYRS